MKSFSNLLILLVSFCWSVSVQAEQLSVSVLLTDSDTLFVTAAEGERLVLPTVENPAAGNFVWSNLEDLTLSDDKRMATVNSVAAGPKNYTLIYTVAEQRTSVLTIMVKGKIDPLTIVPRYHHPQISSSSLDAQVAIFAGAQHCSLDPIISCLFGPYVHLLASERTGTVLRRNTDSLHCGTSAYASLH